MTNIVLLGEARGAEEAKIDSSFVGSSGIELVRMLAEAGVIELTAFDHEYIHRYYETRDPRHTAAIWSLHPEVFRTNVFQIHPPGNELGFFCGPKAEGVAGYPALMGSKYVRREFEPELERLQQELLDHNPNLIVCLGNTALWALGGRVGINKFRGTTLLSTHTVSGFKLLPTYHPAAILYQWGLRPTVVADLTKAAREAKFPEIRRPEREIWIEPTIKDIETFFDLYVRGCSLLSIDIETSGSHITCIGFAPSEKLAIVIPFDANQREGRNFWPTISDERTVWKIIRSILEDRSIKKLFHNGLYDIGFLYKSMKIKVQGATEDSMLLSHALHPESLKGLGFLGSIYSDEGAWKHMRKKDETIKRNN